MSRSSLHFPLDLLKLDLQLDLLLHHSRHRHRCWTSMPPLDPKQLLMQLLLRRRTSGPLKLLPLLSDVGTVEILPLHLFGRPLPRSLSTSSTCPKLQVQDLQRRRGRT